MMSTTHKKTNVITVSSFYDSYCFDLCHQYYICKTQYAEKIINWFGQGQEVGTILLFNEFNCTVEK